MWEAERQRWLEVAEAATPALRLNRRTPVGEVVLEPDAGAFQGWRARAGGPTSTREMGRGDRVVLDFGEHLVGRFGFRLEPVGVADSPARLRLVFAETAAEAAEPFDPYTGALSRAWLQDEVINLDTLPAEIELPRRYAFRYAAVTVVDTSPSFRVRFSNACCETETSADESAVTPLPPDVPAPLQRIDAVALRTLRNCMQTVFEDGPKRDRRLWLGDLRLQALTNAATFRNFGLVKRCLCLFAALAREDGVVPACVYERPEPQMGGNFILDYALLFGPTLRDYLRHSGDLATARDLWPVALRQMELARECLDNAGLFRDPGGWWLFIDWQQGLHKETAMHGLAMFCLREMLALAREVGGETPEEAAWMESTLAHMARAVAGLVAPEGFAVSGPERQVSVASQAWLILGGALAPEAGATALRRALASPTAVKPAGPYLWHCVVEAMLACGLRTETMQLVEDYWGGMVERGATTFWEVFDPADDLASPYGSHHVNSYCHAWSCTPSWFIRHDSCGQL